MTVFVRCAAGVTCFVGVLAAAERVPLEWTLIALAAASAALAPWWAAAHALAPVSMPAGAGR